VMLCSSITRSLGLSDTLGAFLGGMLLSETKYVHKIEADIAPLRGLLLGLFFVTVGFSIDIVMVFQQFAVIVPVIIALLVLKALVVLGAGRLSGMTVASSVQSAALLAPGGEFAFVVLGSATQLGILPEATASMLITATAVSMGLTPVLDKIGASYAQKLRALRGTSSVTGSDDISIQQVAQMQDRSKIIVVCGYGRVGKMVCNMLDKDNLDYIVLERSPVISIKARSSGLPVFMADATDPVVLSGFNVGDAAMVVVSTTDADATTDIAYAVQSAYPHVSIFARAHNDDHKKELEEMESVTGHINAMAHDDELRNISFGGLVLDKVGVAASEVEEVVKEAQFRMQPGLISTTESKSSASRTEIQQVFNIYDADGSGVLDLSEFKEAMGKFKTIDDEELADMFDNYCDDEGNIDFDSFAQFVEA